MRAKLVNTDGKRDRLAATLLMIIAALMFAGMQLMVKLSGSGGRFSLMQQIFFNNLVGVIFTSVVLLKKRISPFGTGAARPWMFLRTIAGFLSAVAFFYATNHARITDVNILNRLSPIVVLVLSAIFLREKTHFSQYIAVVVAFAGAVLVCGPSFASAPLPMIMGIVSAVLAGIAMIAVAYLKDKADPMCIAFFFAFFSALAAGIGMIPSFVMPTFRELLQLLLIGVFGTAGQIVLTYAYRMAPASEISIFDYTGIIWTAILGGIFLRETIPLTSALGALLITGAAVYSFLHKRRKSEG